MATKFITISVEIMRDPNLNQSQKFLLAEIEQLTTLEKGCIASNLHFSNLIGISKENVSKNINDLVKKGYITVEIVAGSRNHTRIITITTLVRPPYQNSKTPLSNRQETKENKQSNKTTNIDYYDDFLTLWNNYASTNNKSKVLKLSSTRKKKIALRDKDFKDFKGAFSLAIEKAKASTFLKDNNFFSFDWLIENDGNIVKVIEDKYKNKEVEWK
jgi:hypothetical protein